MAFPDRRAGHRQGLRNRYANVLCASVCECAFVLGKPTVTCTELVIINLPPSTHRMRPLAYEQKMSIHFTGAVWLFFLVQDKGGNVKKNNNWRHAVWHQHNFLCSHVDTLIHLWEGGFWCDYNIWLWRFDVLVLVVNWSFLTIVWFLNNQLFLMCNDLVE